MRRIVLAAFALTVLAACQPETTELTEEQKAEIAAEARAAFAAFTDAFEQGDIERGVSHYLDSPETSTILAGRIYAQGFDDLSESLRTSFANMGSVDWTATTSHATVLAPDVVCFVEEGTVSMVDTEGRSAPWSRFGYTAVLVRRDGEWKVIHTHTSYLP